jgi:hypothetical protein
MRIIPITMKVSQRFWPKWCFSILIGCTFIVSPAFAGLLPFPLSANQRGTVACLENPSYTYDIYLPPAYSTSGTPLHDYYGVFTPGDFTPPARDLTQRRNSDKSRAGDAENC